MKFLVRAARFGSALVIGVLVATGGVLAQEQAAPTGPAAAPPGSDSSDAIMARLQDTIVDAGYQAVDFSKVVDDLRERYGLNIHVAWNAMEDSGVRRDDRVTVELRQVPLATVLEMVCQELGDDPEAISYGVRAGVVVIAPGAELRRARVTRPYDVTDLIESGYATRRFANTPVLSLELTGREFVGGEMIARTGSAAKAGGTGGGGGVFGDPGDEEPHPSRMERMQEIVDLLTSTVDPDLWVDNGGDVASVRAFNGTLLIHHTVEGHRRVGSFFDLLRAGRPHSLDGEAIIARLRPGKAGEWRAAAGARYPRIDGARLPALLESLGEEGILFRAGTSAFNGERMWFSAVGQRSVLTTLIPIVGDNAQAMQPITEVATDGLELIVLPLLRPQSDELTLDVQMAWVPTSKVDQRSIAMATPDTQGSVDLVNRNMRTVSTTARLRLGEALVLTIPERVDDQGRAAPYEDWLIVLVRRTP